jgi:hypothetical protein
MAVLHEELGNPPQFLKTPGTDEFSFVIERCGPDAEVLAHSLSHEILQSR